jgi:hypothetical protein
VQGDILSSAPLLRRQNGIIAGMWRIFKQNKTSLIEELPPTYSIRRYASLPVTWCFGLVIFGFILIRAADYSHMGHIHRSEMGRTQLRGLIPRISTEVDERPRIAVCFFGLTRSLKYTLPTIQGNLLGPINRAGYAVDVFLHTYNDVAHLNNPRTGENSDLDQKEWQILEPLDAVLTSQTTFLRSIKCDPTYVMVP